MRLQIFSDLHGDVRPPKHIEVAPGVDAVVVAGDTCEGAERGFERLRQIVPMQLPIVMVMGNHEYYRRHVGSELAAARRAAPLYGIHLLEDDVVTLANVKFVGCSLWTDYAVFGDTNVPRAMRAASDGLNDHRKITWAKQPWQRFRPQEALLLHRQSRAFINAALTEPFTSVVLTHHAPHPGSLHPRYQNDVLSAAYVSDLTAVIQAGKPDLWVHGHVHASFDYHVGGTHIVCNPHGYGAENPQFDPALVVEVG
ncbi:MAG: metallophosphoesterase family protein [Rhizobiales bacterium]|nr:metallophosphoesterase family protein [Hyphomicrobiales bacterium]